MKERTVYTCHQCLCKFDMTRSFVTHARPCEVPGCDLAFMTGGDNMTLSLYITPEEAKRRMYGPADTTPIHTREKQIASLTPLPLAPADG